MNEFKKPLHAIIYKGLESDTANNPCNTLIAILSDDTQDFSDYDVAVIDQIRQLKNTFHDLKLLNEACLEESIPYSKNISSKKVSQFFEEKIFNYSSFLDKYNLVVCKHALLALEGPFSNITTPKFFNDVKQAMRDNIREQLQRNMPAFVEFINANIK